MSTPSFDDGAEFLSSIDYQSVAYGFPAFCFQPHVSACAGIKEPESATSRRHDSSEPT
jgi:hypothetical protein